MPVFDVPTTPKHGQFRATVGFDLIAEADNTNTASGQVRIEPPFELAEEEYKYYEDIYDVIFEPYASGSAATILKLEILDIDKAEASPRIAESVSSLLEVLGALSSKELFTAGWLEERE